MKIHAKTWNCGCTKKITDYRSTEIAEIRQFTEVDKNLIYNLQLGKIEKLNSVEVGLSVLLRFA